MYCNYCWHNSRNLSFCIQTRRTILYPYRTYVLEILVDFLSNPMKSYKYKILTSFILNLDSVNLASIAMNITMYFTYYFLTLLLYWNDL